MLQFSDSTSPRNGSISIDFLIHTQAASLITPAGECCTQTISVNLKEAFTQYPILNDFMVQTETQNQGNSKIASITKLHESDTLSSFLRSVEVEISNMLMENVCTTAYEDWNSYIGMVLEEENEEHIGSMSSLSISDDILSDPEMDANLAIIACSKGISDSSFILAYAVPHLRTSSLNSSSHSSLWCTHSSYLSFWCFNKKTDFITLPSCVTCMASQGKEYVVIGTFVGQVYVWDLTSTPSSLLSSPQSMEHSHLQPVTQVSWGPQEEYVWSIGLDGKVKEWHLFTLTIRREVMVPCHPHVDLGVGLVGMTWYANLKSSMLFIFTTETGTVMHVNPARWSTTSTTHTTPPFPSNHVSILGPVFLYRGHLGLISHVSLNVFVPIFFTLGRMDHQAHFYRLFQDSPIHSIAFPSTPILGAWSPQRPALLAITFADQLCLFDLTALPYQPSATLALPCLGPLMFHPTLPLLYVAIQKDGRSGLQTVRLSSKWANVDISIRKKDIACLNTMLGQLNNEIVQEDDDE